MRENDERCLESPRSLSGRFNPASMTQKGSKRVKD